MAKEMLLWLFLGNAAFVVIYGASLSTTTTAPKTCVDPDDGTIREEDTWWYPEKCKACRCKNGEIWCGYGDCFEPNYYCVDLERDPSDCCDVCPRGANCQWGNEIIPYRQTITLDDGRICHCEGEEFGYLEAVCVSPTPPPPTTTTTPTTTTSTTTLSAKAARQQAKAAARQAKAAQRQAEKEARQATRKANREAKKAEREAKRAARKARKANSK